MANSEDSKDKLGNADEDLRIFETLCISSPDKVHFIFINCTLLNFFLQYI